ncbi:ATP-binding protein [Campylobacter lari]|uniref:ATP-binding protein n=3 Tax=Campylobacter TaxID=194 RepID=UPI0012C40DB7|nr:ATP-binding protein [Campylobacter lari]EAJ6150256.1 ATP-binding protein [Campylobacter lari]EAL0060193.1 ATP-binding protein [Campylobacter lari]MCR2081591.1 ATP-binding protein [Campylobacter lari subsp. concheus]
MVKYIMMKKLKIKNFGPIKDINIEIKPFTILIGKSGSGKSILMKLIYSFDIIINNLTLLINNKQYSENIFGENKIEFDLNEIGRIFNICEIDDFFNNDTEIIYTSINNTIEVQNNKVVIFYNTQIVSEQVFISDLRYIIPDILSYNFDRSIRISEILNNTMEYFLRGLKFNDNSYKLEMFNIELLQKLNKVTNDFLLQTKDYTINYKNASSGVKSASIIEVIISYLLKETSQERKINLDIPSKPQAQQTNIFIEEPELSLFPEHQKEILHFILKSFLSHTLEETEIKYNKLNFIISTHSPFILYYLSNILTGIQLHKQENLFTMGKIEKIIPKELLRLDINDIEIYKLEEGTIASILDKKEYFINTQEMDKTAEILSNDYTDLLNLQNEDL